MRYKKRYNPRQLRIGFKIEQEHYNTVNGNKIKIGKIVRDHLREFPNYYTHLLRMERKLKKRKKKWH